VFHIFSSFFFRPSFSPLGQIDVTTIPDQGSWLQLIQDGTTQINTGANGIQRLDKLIALAKQHNIYIYFTLTNNWFPSTTGTPTPSTAPSPLARNFLSNDYGRYLMLVELCALFPD
jgi:mannan endo-1,4-beta-mannosidase